MYDNMTMSVTREAIEEGLNVLSDKSQRLIDMYDLHDIDFNSNEAVEACASKLAECNQKEKIWDYLKKLLK